MDLIFYLKTGPSSAEKALPWPGPVKFVGLDPVAMGLGCGGADAYCSTAFSKMWQALRGADGAVVPKLIAKHGGDAATRVAFVGFSAAHGFLNPLLNNDADRARTSAVVMMDTCFGSGKTGFIKALRDAAAGRMLYATFTAHPPGAKIGSAGILQSGTECFMQQVLAPSGLRAELTEPRAPMFMPKGGTWRIGDLGFWLRGVDDTGHVDVPHYELGSKQQSAMVAAYLVPYWRGELGGRIPAWVYAVATAAAIAGGGYYLLRRRG